MIKVLSDKKSEWVRPTKEESNAAILMYQNGTEEEKQKAAEKIVEMYSRWAMSMAYFYAGIYMGEYYSDLYQCSVVGLLEAAKTYDPNKGSFTTHSKQYIHHEVYQYTMIFIDKQQSWHYARLQNKVSKAISKIEDDGRPVNWKELAKEAGISEKIAKQELLIYFKTEVGIEDAYNIAG